ncbi:MAG: hypothetical protein ACPGSE_00185 [Synechococcus sp.]
MDEDEVLTYDTRRGRWVCIKESDVPAWHALAEIEELMRSEEPLDVTKLEELVGLVAQSSLDRVHLQDAVATGTSWSPEPRPLPIEIDNWTSQEWETFVELVRAGFI